MIEQKPIFRLSVLLVTYNHEQYIRKTLTSLFHQILDEPIELIIADDSSTDNTLAIIKEYEHVDSRFQIKYLDNTVNQGITKNYQCGFAACSGEYIAVLEGDDYWITPYKLQQQINFLANHWECNLCSANYFVFEEYRRHFYPRTAVDAGHRLLSARELIADNLVGNFSTCMYRKSAINTLPERLFELCSYDWIVNICIASDSLIGFLNEPMSVYRLHSNGVWTKTSTIDKLQQQLALIPHYDQLTNYVYQAEFKLLANHLQSVLARNKLTNTLSTTIKPMRRFFVSLNDYLPPIVLYIAKALTPPKLKHFFIKIRQRGVG